MTELVLYNKVVRVYSWSIHSYLSAFTSCSKFMHYSLNIKLSWSMLLLINQFLLLIYVLYNSYDLHFSILLITYLAGGFSKVAGHSMLKYMKAKTTLKSVFSLLRRVPLIDVGSVKGIVLVC